jgi:hypothetical protein
MRRRFATRRQAVVGLAAGGFAAAASAAFAQQAGIQEYAAMNVARRIALAESDGTAWTIIRESREDFLWTDDEEPEATWNRLAAREGLNLELTLAWSNEDKPVLQLANSRLRVPLVHTRDDRFIVLHAISQIGKDVLEIRYCKASAHSSDQAYLPCPPHMWQLLEKDLGPERVAKQFLALPADVKEFARLLYAPGPPPSWAS